MYLGSLRHLAKLPGRRPDCRRLFTEDSSHIWKTFCVGQSKNTRHICEDVFKTR